MDISSEKSVGGSIGVSEYFSLMQILSANTSMRSTKSSTICLALNFIASVMYRSMSSLVSIFFPLALSTVIACSMRAFFSSNSVSRCLVEGVKMPSSMALRMFVIALSVAASSFS